MDIPPASALSKVCCSCCCDEVSEEYNDSKHQMSNVAEGGEGCESGGHRTKSGVGLRAYLGVVGHDVEMRGRSFFK